jgi:uncharacterized membrane protein YphA (DoxX/SURF4 family)
MNAAIWVVQILVGVAFTISGLGKLTRSREQMLKQMKYIEDLSDSQVRGVGAAELLGGIGVVLPAWTGIAPVLTPIAASGLVIVMVGAMVVHVRRKEYNLLPLNAVLLVLAAFVAITRFGAYAY